MDVAATPARASEAIRRRFERIATIGEAEAVLSWDASAVMPDGGAEARGGQLALLAGLGHAMLVEPEAGAELDRAEAELRADPPDDGAGWERANLALMRRAHAAATALPDRLVEALARRASSCEHAWRRARETDDFTGLLPEFEPLLALAREQAERLAGATGLAPYDALMDRHQPGVVSAEVEPVFDRIEAFIRAQLPAAERRRDAAPPPIPLPPAAEDLQEALCRGLATGAGLDFHHARLDRSAHPFCGGIPDDVRITTRYDVADPSRALLGVLHETGHALYERNLPAAWRRQPVGAAAGMAAHETQSLIVEMQACRSDAFLGFLGTALQDALGGPSAAYAPENLRRLWRRVERSLIRVDADEMTYPAHVILRFRLERDLIEGRLAARDLPGAWSDGLHALLGIRPPDDRTGCLQDIHWYAGLFGYFPCYSLGAMGAAQLMAACRRTTPELDAALAKGDLSPLIAWLATHVHAQGARLGFSALLVHATGKPLDPGDFEAHLQARYLA